MKKLFTIFFFLATFTFTYKSATGQEIVEKISEDNIDFQQTVNDAETYFNVVGRGKGTGYKLYQRWKARASARVMADGRVLSNNTLADVLKIKSKPTKQKSASSNWQPLGPLAWTNGGGYNPGVGRVTAIAVEPTNQQIIFIGSPGGGLWKSTNGGSSWQAIGDDLSVMHVWGIAIDPSDSNTVYYGDALGDLYKSINGGKTFSKILDKSGGKIRSILIHPTNSNILHVAIWTINPISTSGIYKTTDGGSSWTQVSSEIIEDLLYKPGSTSTIYASGDDFYRSTDSGDSYTKITSGIQSSQRMKIAVTPASSNYVYIVQKNGGQFGWFYKSTDGGASFTVKKDHTNAPNYIGNQASRDMAITVSNTDANEVHIGGFDMYVTTDGGDNFTQECDWYYPYTTPGGSSSGHSYVHADIEVLQYIDGNIYAGTDGGIYKSTDGGDNFTDLSAGLGITQFYRINSSLTDRHRVVGGSQDNGTNVMSGPAHEWLHMMGADGMDGGIHPTNPDTIYAMIQRGKLYKSTNGGQSRFFPSQPPESGSGLWITPFAIDPNNGDKLYAGYDDLYRSNNGASGSWDNLSAGISFGGKLKHIELCPSDSNKIYVARGSQIWVSTDLNNSTPSWTDQSSGIIGTINDIAVDPLNSSRVVVCTSYGNVYESTNSGSSWTNIKSGLPSIPVISCVLNKSSAKGIYVATDGAVYFKDNNTPWTLYSNSLPNVSIDEIELYYGSSGQSRVRVATYGRGLWEVPFFDEGGITCSQTITSYPYNESFESGLGAWTQDTGDDADWTHQTGGTPSTGTGPSGAADGIYYEYFETSHPNYPKKTAYLISPCFDMDNLSSPKLTFKYHMLGADVGTLNLEVTTDDSIWTSVWDRSGDQGSNWNDGTVDLSAYAGSIVRLRFNAVSDDGWQGDICIDKLTVENDTKWSVSPDVVTPASSLGSQEGKHVLVFPNPTFSIVHIQLQTKGEPVLVELMDLSGKRVLEETFKTTEGINLLKVPTFDLPNGTYILRVSSGNFNFNEKLIVTDSK